jgi:DNA adenine methylase
MENQGLMSFDNRKNCKPFLKWAGGKRKLLKYLDRYIPSEFGRYFEPFLGGGAMFFHLMSSRGLQIPVYLSDVNTELITTYTVIKHYCEELIQVLNTHKELYKQMEYYDNDKERFFSQYYDKIRATTYIDPIQVAARLIFLNKTGFNGLQRYNSLGEFNVPQGDYEDPQICDAANLRDVSIALSNASITSCHYMTALAQSQAGDFIYLDPPYLGVYNQYTADKFIDQSHMELAKLFHELDAKGCKLLLSNSDKPEVRELYSGFKIATINAPRSINSDAKNRGSDKTTELIICN